MLRYYEVTAKCGHVGKMNYIPIIFPCCAENGKEVADKVRWFPRVKHHHKDAIQFVREITYEQYSILQDFNATDPYLQCENSKEQKQIPNLLERIQKEKAPIQFNKNKRSPCRYQKSLMIEKEMQLMIRLYSFGIQQVTI